MTEIATTLAGQEHGVWTPHPAGHDDSACALALLTEIAADEFGLGPLPGPASAYHWPAEPVIAAAGTTLTAFTSAIARGLHGPGCVGRDEEDAADQTADRGGRPHCAECGEEIHMFPGLGPVWRHYQVPGAARAPSGSPAPATSRHWPGDTAPDAHARSTSAAGRARSSGGAIADSSGVTCSA